MVWQLWMVTESYARTHAMAMLQCYMAAFDEVLDN